MSNIVCQNLKLVKGLEKLMLKSPWYDSEEADQGCDQLPETMRDLVERNFTGSVFDGMPELKNDISLPDGGQVSRCLIPISAVDLKRKFPDGSQDKAYNRDPLRDYRGMHPMLSAFWKWLEINEPNRVIDIDHHLLNHDHEGWPLLNYFQSLIIERTGFTYWDMFPQEEWECCEGEEQLYDRAVMDIYRTGFGSDREPLLEFVNELTNWKSITCFRSISLPEAAFEAAGSEEAAQRCMSIFVNVLVEDRLDLLVDKNWRKALEVLADTVCPFIICEDPEQEAAVYLTDADSVDSFFELGRAVHEIRRAVDDLVNEFETGFPEKFWKKFIRNINAIAEKEPSLAGDDNTSAKTLIEVLG